MGTRRKIISTMSAPFVIVFLLSNCYALGRSDANLIGKGLRNHSEIHEAKNLIDALSFKLHLNLRKSQSKYESLTLQSNQYLAQSGSTRDEIKMLDKLKELLNDLTKKNSVCEKFYTNFDFTAAREIMINSSASLQKDHTVILQGILSTE